MHPKDWCLKVDKANYPWFVYALKKDNRSMNLYLTNKLLDWKLAHINPVLRSQSSEEHSSSCWDLLLAWILPMTLQRQTVFFDLCAHLLHFLYHIFKAGVHITGQCLCKRYWLSERWWSHLQSRAIILIH